MLSLALSLALSLSGPSLLGGDPLPLSGHETLLFLAVTGDFSGEHEVEIGAFLREEQKLVLMGDPVRSAATKTTRIWAVATSETPKKLVWGLLRPLKKLGYRPALVHASAFKLIAQTKLSLVRQSLRNLEREDRKVLAASLDSRAGLFWVFHDDGLNSKKLLSQLRDFDIQASYHHLEIRLQARTGSDLTLFAASASAHLDLARVSQREDALVIDLYLRDLPSMLALSKSRTLVPCPDVLPFLGEVPAGELEWLVDLDLAGFPFAG